MNQNIKHPTTDFMTEEQITALPAGQQATVRRALAKRARRRAREASK